MALLSSFGSNSRGGGGGGGLRSKVSSESWADFHKKHRSRPTYVGSSANKRRADLSSGMGMGRRASMGGSGSSSETAGSRIFGGEGSSPSNQRRRSSMY